METEEVTYKHYVKLLNSRIGLTILLSTVLLFIPIPIFTVLSFVGFFAAFDVLGYKFLSDGKNNPSYRIIQLMFQVFLTLAIGKMYGWKAAIECTIAWWLLASDVVYYWILGVKLDAFHWWKYSPIVFIAQKVFKMNAAPASWVLASAIIGTFGSALYNLIF